MKFFGLLILTLLSLLVLTSFHRLPEGYREFEYGQGNEKLISSKSNIPSENEPGITLGVTPDGECNQITLSLQTNQDVVGVSFFQIRVNQDTQVDLSMEFTKELSDSDSLFLLWSFRDTTNIFELTADTEETLDLEKGLHRFAITAPNHSDFSILFNHVDFEIIKIVKPK